MLPKIEALKNDWNNSGRRLLILAEGFENRATTFVKSDSCPRFDHVIICEYEPIMKSNINSLLNLLSNKISAENITIIKFNRFIPRDFECDLKEFLLQHIDKFTEIVIDISVMSKLLIVSIVWLLRDYSAPIRIIYTEPLNYSPSEIEFESQRNNSITSFSAFNSLGIFDVVRTPELSSVIMQQSSNILIAFTSFNECLLHSMLSSISPTHFFLIGSVPPILSWREKAAQDLHISLIEDFSNDNPKNENGLLERRSSTLDYTGTFEILAQLYKKYCYDYRIVVAPTGSKMQALGVAIFKCCSPDVHIEYPTPETYRWENYSSTGIRQIYQVRFENFKKLLKPLSDFYCLNG